MLTLVFVLVISVMYQVPQANSASVHMDLQTTIDAAPPNSTLTIPSGEYAGPIVINKTLQLKAEGAVVIINESDQPALMITADHVSIKGMQIKTRTVGIKATDAHYLHIADNRIAFLAKDNTSSLSGERGNGIDLFHSHVSTIINNNIANLQDGIYLETSHAAQVKNNVVSHSRYGVHCMYVNDLNLLNNQMSDNITGAMIMVAEKAVIKDNRFAKQSENVTAQGLLLFDTHNSTVSGNILADNRVGLHIEDATDNLLTNNQISGNFIGVQFFVSSNNTLSNNQFVANVILAQATDSQNNNLHSNYWDSFKGIDIDGDGKSNISFKINPFFQKLTDKVPAFQLFFQAPGMPLIENVLATDSEAWTTDRSPLMYSPISHNGPKYEVKVLIFSLVLLGLASMIMLRINILNVGGKRN